MKRNFSNRTNLCKEIPLKAPFIVAIEPTNVCNLECRFCWHAIDKDRNINKMPKPHSMTYDDFCRVADSIKDSFGSVKKVVLNGTGESLLCYDFSDMISYAKKSEIGEKYTLYSNGILLNHDLSHRLVCAFESGSGFNEIQFSINHISDEGYYRVTRRKVNYDKLRSNIEDFHSLTNKKHTKVVCKLINDGDLSDTDVLKFYSDFADIGCDVIVEHAYKYTQEWAYKPGDEIIGYDGQLSTMKKVCPLPFFACYISADLRVGGCLACDYQIRNYVGNLRDSSIGEIWNGIVYNNFRKKILMGGALEDCSYCASLHLQPDNIDDCAEELLLKLKGLEKSI